MLTFRSVAEHPNPSSLLPQALEWLAEAGTPYYEWLLGGEAQARTILMEMLKNDESEVAFRRMRMIMLGGECIGGYFGLSGAELKKARLADASIMWKHTAPAERNDLLKRLEMTTKMFLPVLPDVYYLSKGSLDKAHQGKALGVKFVKAAIEEAKSLGFPRLRLDVCATNERALRCYLYLGFEIVHTAEHPEVPTKFFCMRRSETVAQQVPEQHNSIGLNT